MEPVFVCLLLVGCMSFIAGVVLGVEELINYVDPDEDVHWYSVAASILFVGFSIGNVIVVAMH
ncbi:hypothetical protein [Actinoallomurus sp. NPDC052274]|uniref:hypothetical protein n=1 Tax=Actinoallomurus sp. NPDC052274 TaxID=3155420 RepID=UPI003416A6CC